MSHLIFVRHGESELNVANKKQRIFCGQTETPLTDVGRQQASDVGKTLAARSDLCIECAISSVLSRARDTLERILEELERSHPSSVVKRCPDSPDLNERSLGDFEERVAEEVYAEFPEYKNDPDYNQFQYHFTQRAPRGENLEEVTARAWPVVQRLESECSGDILIVSHFTTIRCILGIAMKWPEQRILDTKIVNAVPVIVRRGETYQLLEGVVPPE